MAVDFNDMGDDDLIGLAKANNLSSNGNEKLSTSFNDIPNDDLVKLAKANGIAKPESEPVHSSWLNTASDNVLAAAASFGNEAFRTMLQVGSAPGRLLEVATGGRIKAPYSTQELEGATSDKLQQSIKEAYPDTQIAQSIGGFAGSVAPYLFMPATGAKSFLGKVATSAAEAGSLGFLQGVGTAKPGEEIKQGALTGTLSGLLGGAASAVGQGVAKVFGHGNSAVKVPDSTQAENTLTRILDDIAPVSDDVIKSGQQSAKQVLKNQKNIYGSLVDDTYRSAYTVKVPLDKIDETLNDPVARDAVNFVVDTFQKSKPGKNPLADRFNKLPDDSLVKWDYIKRGLDDRIVTLGKKSPNAAAELRTVKNNLLNVLDEVSPDYAVARELAGDAAEGLKQLSSTPIGKLASGKEGQLNAITKKIFNPTTPREVMVRMRDGFVKTDKNAWNSLIRNYLEESIGNQKITGKGDPLALYKAALDTPNKRKVLLEAMDFAGNEAQKVKILALDKLYQQATNQTTTSRLFRKSPLPDMVKGDTGNIFNNRVINFINNTDLDKEIRRLYKNTKLSDEQITEKLIEMVRRQPSKLPAKTATGLSVNTSALLTQPKD